MSLLAACASVQKPLSARESVQNPPPAKTHQNTRHGPKVRAPQKKVSKSKQKKAALLGVRLNPLLALIKCEKT